MAGMTHALAIARSLRCHSIYRPRPSNGRSRPQARSGPYPCGCFPSQPRYEPRRVFNMTTNTDGPTIDPTAAAEAQAKLTKSVGERLPPKNQDATVPLYKRWLKRTPHA
jgi:hypothetical protein